MSIPDMNVLTVILNGVTNEPGNRFEDIVFNYENGNTFAIKRGSLTSFVGTLQFLVSFYLQHQAQQQLRQPETSETLRKALQDRSDKTDPNKQKKNNGEGEENDS